MILEKDRFHALNGQDPFDGMAAAGDVWYGVLNRRHTQVM